VDMLSGPALTKSGGAQWHSNGVLVEPNAEVFAGVLATLAEDMALTQQMAISSRAFAVSRYSADEAADRVVDLYEELARSKGIEGMRVSAAGSDLHSCQQELAGQEQALER